MGYQLVQSSSAFAVVVESVRNTEKKPWQELAYLLV